MVALALESDLRYVEIHSEKSEQKNASPRSKITSDGYYKPSRMKIILY